jgi:hypothetical protein
LLLAAAAAWLAWWWRRSPWIAGAGAVLIAFGYAAVLAFEMLALRFVNRTDPVPQALWRELGRAWLHEALQDLRVFGWRQPFAWRAVDDRLSPAAQVQGRRGVVFVHGFICNRGFWTPWLRRLEREKHAFVAVNLEPVFGSIDLWVPAIDRAVAAVTQASGLPPLLVCHSMGGLAARAWLRSAAPGRIAHVVTIGTPHHGTWLARFSRTENGRQMRPGSPWLRALQAQPLAGPQPPFTCWYSNCDNVVFPSSTATLPGADNRLLRGAAHVDLAFRPEVMAASFELLRHP